MNEWAVLLAGDLAWPTVILVLALVVLTSQRSAIARLIDRVRSFKYPGGEAELAVVAEVGVATISTVVESLSSNVTVPLEPGKRPDRSGQIEPIQNREPIGYVEPLAIEEVTSLVVLRARAANLLEEIAFPPPPGGFGPVSSTLDALQRRGVLEADQARALAQLVDIADEATRGAMVPRRVAQAVQNSGSAILLQLDKLRTVAGPKFEDHVLDTLRHQLPDGWTLHTDRAIPRDAVAEPDAPANARVDALVTAGDRSVVVEVRARLRPGGDNQIDIVREWVAALPPDLPILLVMLGEPLTDRELRSICAGHVGTVELLLWDREAGALIGTLRELLERPAVRSGSPTRRRAG